MHIESICPGCQRKLRVDAAYAGQSARCPHCHSVYEVPQPDAVPAAPPSDRWFLRVPEGRTYGPVQRRTLDQWVDEGRVSDDCQLMVEADGVWHSPVADYPVLAPAPAPLPAPLLAAEVDTTTPRFPDDSAMTAHLMLASHRGMLILLLGLLSWAFGCPIFSVLAWVMGSRDLRAMREGHMDPEGKGLTQAGQILGIVHVLLALILVVFVAVAALLMGILS
ncbi:MAG: DUF4190 domain-containing protein [Pirellulaceae bacterium]